MEGALQLTERTVGEACKGTENEPVDEARMLRRQKCVIKHLGLGKVLGRGAG